MVVKKQQKSFKEKKRKRKNLNFVMRKRTFRFVSTTWMELLMLALALNVG